MNAGNLTLLGTVHLDPSGEARLLGALGALRPAAVTVEVSPYALEFRRTRGPALRARLEPFRRPDGTLPPGLEAVEAQLALPYEWTAALAYAEGAGLPVEALGDSETSRRWLALLEHDLLDPENLDILAAAEVPILAEQVAWEWASARRHWRAGKTLGSEEVARLQAEDARMAQHLAAPARPAGLVHVTGWEHLRGLAAALGGFEFLLADQLDLGHNLLGVELAAGHDHHLLLLDRSQELEGGDVGQRVEGNRLQEILEHVAGGRRHHRVVGDEILERQVGVVGDGHHHVHPLGDGLQGQGGNAERKNEHEQTDQTTRTGRACEP